jgi:hypothetical protein
MFKKIFIAIVFQGSTMLFAQEGILKIQVTDKVTGELLEAANVIIESAGVTAGSGITDEKGNLVLKNLSPGKYNVKTIYTGYPKNLITGVIVKNNETTYLDVAMSSENILIDFDVTEYVIPLIDPSTIIKRTFTLDDIRVSPLDPLALVYGEGTQKDQGISPSFRGARQDANVIMIDGQRVIGSAGLPRMAIQQISVMLGGVPAQYGDGTGGFIEIETRSGLVNTGR